MVAVSLAISAPSAEAAPACGSYTTYSNSYSYGSAYAEAEIKFTDPYGKACSQYDAVNYAEWYVQCTGTGDEFKLYLDKNPQGTEDCSTSDFNCDGNGCSNYDRMWNGNEERAITTRTTSGNIKEAEWLCWARDDSGSDWAATWQAGCLYTNDEVNQQPDPPNNPSPSDGATDVPRSPTTLSVDVSDPDGDTMDVSFYDSSGSLIGTDSSVASGGTASATWSDTAPDTTYSWYAVADDGNDVNTQSSTWSFTTEPNNPPGKPEKLEPSGDNEPLSPPINATYSDPDGDSGTLHFETGSGSSIGSCSVSDGSKCSVTYSSADEPNTNYTFQVYAEDEYGATSAIASQSFITRSDISSISNSEAPEGSIWIENDELHWADGSTERYLDSVNLVESDSPGPVGSWWIEGSSMHWIDQNSDERSYTASDTGKDPSGASPGNVWIENGLIHYIDANGNERKVK